MQASTPAPSRLPPGRIPGLLLLVLMGATASCGPPRVVLVDRGLQAYYQTAYPVHDTSRELHAAFRSVKQVTYSADYVTYVFPETARIIDQDLVAEEILALAVDTLPESHAKAGTATIVSRSGPQVTLLTNNHVVYFPPVMIQYYDQEGATGRIDPSRPRYVAGLSLRVAETGALAEHPDLGPFGVIARDEAVDLALIGIELRDWSDPALFPPLAIPPGEPRRLSWGSFVYVLGFPRGYQMVTRGIVSDPDRDRRGSFLTDGLWNEGISGGAILAVRGDTGNLEWVGLARAGAAAREVRVQPALDAMDFDVELRHRYDGPLYLESVPRIQYGVTLAVPMSLVRTFYDQNRVRLRSRGFHVPAY